MPEINGRVDCGSSLRAAAEALRRGDGVLLRPMGGSMTPRIRSGQQVLLEPLQAGEVPRPGEAVLAVVNRRLYLHLILQVRGDRVKIGSARGSVNGWTAIENVFGKVARVL